MIDPAARRGREPSVKDGVADSSQVAQKLERVDADERRIAKIRRYERWRLGKVALFVFLGASWFIGGIRSWRGVALAGVLLAVALLPYLGLRLWRRWLERRRDRVLDSVSSSE